MKTRVLLMIMGLLHVHSNAQIGFEDSIVLSREAAIGDVQQVSSADIDNDGDADVIVASHNKFGWLENYGQGQFSNLHVFATISTSTPSNTRIFLTDIDNDGDVDVFTAFADDIIGDKIVWYENMDGLGNFSEQIIISLDIETIAWLHGADIDGDGDTDLVSTSLNDVLTTFDESKLAWYENIDGSGTFGPQQIISSAFQSDTAITADLDLDGDLDIIASADTGLGVVWFENLDGSGSFGTEQSIDAIDYYRAKSLVSEDFDGDGDFDLAVAYTTSSIASDMIYWYENMDGLGNFGSRQVITSEIDDVRTIIAFDYENDGDLDLVSASENDDKVAFYNNMTGLGDFGSQQVITTSFNRANSICAADVNNDGRTDIFGGTHDINTSGEFSQVAFFINSPTNFSIERIIATEYGSTSSAHAVDMDNDGNKDIIASYSSFDQNKFLWLRNIDGNLNQLSPNFVFTNYNGDVSLVPIDFNNDGLMDVIVATGFHVVLFQNFGFGYLGAVDNIATNVHVTSLFTTDLNGDGFEDLVLSDAQNTITWYKNQAGIFFMAQANISTTAGGATSVFAADMDNDGDNDIVSALRFDDQIAWYENLDGAGNFGTIQVISAETNAPLSVFCVDIDNDGDMDVLSASNLDDKVAWYENMDGQGLFGTQQIISTLADGAQSVYAGDMDNDGDMDVLSISTIDNKIAWYDNLDGQGTFSPQKIISNNVEDLRTVFMADMDNDGHMDVISTTGSKVTVHKNLGNVNEIFGVVKFDADANGCNDADAGVSNMMVLTESSEISIATFTNQTGLYQLQVPAGEYTTSVVSNLPTYYSTNPSSHFSEFTDNEGTDTANFCIEPNQLFNDLEVSIYPYLSDPRPGFVVNYQVVYKNIGTTILDGHVTFQYDGAKLNFLSASETVNAQTSNTLTFDFTDLNPFETKTIDLEFQVFTIPITNIGDILEFTATVNPVTGDNNEEDNVFNFDQTVIGAYDPNDITVLEGDQIHIEDADNYLHYIIRFQNTGTADAINVRVENILDDKMEWSTLQLESASHASRVEIRDGNEVSFKFNNIHLPDSISDEPNSHGYIAYKIKPKSNVAIGNIISNTADIFFDFNPPIVTNTVTTEIVNTLSVAEFEATKVTLYPNPSDGILNIVSNTSIIKIEIYNQLGQLVLSEKETLTIDISHLSQGIYMISLSDVLGNTFTKKVIKQ